MPSPRPSERTLVIGFLTILAAVPVTQTGLELARHERVQFTDVFRYQPSSRNLRQFEETLEAKSWFQQRLRPVIQRLAFAALRETGSKAVRGRDGWLFYRPDLRYLVESDRPETDPREARWAPPRDSASPSDNVVRAIVRFRDQLKDRGVALVVVPLPGKTSVYPDQVTRRHTGRWPDLRSPTEALLDTLRREGVPAVDLFARFRETRSQAPEAGPSPSLYLARDTHWTPLGAQLAAQTTAARLRELQLAPPPLKTFQARPVSVARWGDVLDMMQVPGLRDAFPLETVLCEQVTDPILGPLVPSASDRPGTYRYPGQQASVLVLGDSFCRIYQFPEPQSLGVWNDRAADSRRSTEPGTKRLLPGSAGFVSHLARALQSPVDAIVSDGGASTDVRRKLSTNPEILEGKRVVIWAFVERDLALGRHGWEDVPLPARLN